MSQSVILMIKEMIPTGIVGIPYTTRETDVKVDIADIYLEYGDTPAIRVGSGRKAKHYNSREVQGILTYLDTP